MAAVLLNANDLIESSKTEPPVQKEVEVEAQANKPDDTTHASAFMVLVTKDGHYIFEPDINAIVIPERPPTPSEIKGALSTILLDITAQETAILSSQMTVQTQMNMARQMQEQAQNQQLMSQMGLGRR